MGKGNNKLLILYRRFYYFIFLLVTFAVIYLLFPKQGTFKYEFQKGKPWGHPTLIAPFDFPILKAKEILQVEKDSLLKNFIPFFSVKPEIQEQEIALLKDDLQAAFIAYAYPVDSTLQNEIINRLLILFSSFYEHGIVENSVDTYKALTEKQSINLVSDNLAVKVSVTSVLSLKSVYLAVNDTLKVWAQSDSVLLGVQRHIDLNKYLAANLSYDEVFNNMQIKELVESVSTTSGIVQAGVRIISEGDLVSGDNYLVLESLRQAYERTRSYGGWISTIIIGQMILILTLLTILVLYLQNFNKKIFWKKRNFSMILTTVLTTVILARALYVNDAISMYLLPVCMLPIIIRTFLGARMAIFIHLVTMLIIGFMAPNSFEYVFIQSVAGIVAVISLSKLHRRVHLFYAALLLILVYMVMYFGFELIKEGEIRNIEWTNFIWFIGNGFLLLSAYPLIFIIEKVFGFISDVTLMELSDTNHPLLRELAETAPGTFQHSMQVANMAEEVIIRTGGNPMLVRTGALYHDVGKIKSSQFFIENQSIGENPHDKLSNKESVERIVSHVFDGVKLARKYNLPDPIIDFIKMHHGKSMVKYFYLKYKEAHPDEMIKEEDFRYPGPNPTSRETAVVMLADGVEAASRSLPEKNEETLSKIINQIIDSKVQNHELDDAPITFKDIKDIKAIFLEKLKTVYHLRIQYPKEIESNKEK